VTVLVVGAVVEISARKTQRVGEAKEAQKVGEVREVREAQKHTDSP
jgi:hypothetical protein